jgi:hypothetical protein
MGTITSANATATLTVPQVFAGAQLLQGFMTDDAWDTEDVTPVESRIGVDAQKSDGYTPYLTKQLWHFQADSSSIALFDQWEASQAANREVYRGTVSLWLPSIGKIYTFNQASFTRYKPTPSGKKVLEGQVFELTYAWPINISSDASGNQAGLGLTLSVNL